MPFVIFFFYPYNLAQVRNQTTILASEIMCICLFMLLIYMATQGLVSEIALMATTRLVIHPKHYLLFLSQIGLILLMCKH